MSDNLDRLAALAGIEGGYWDIFGTHHPVTDETKRGLLTAMGIAVDSEDRIAEALKIMEETPWRRLVSPVTVVRRPMRGHISVAVAQELEDKIHAWTLFLEDGTTRCGSGRVADLPTVGAREMDGTRYLRKDLHLTEELPFGYHRIEIEIGGRSGGGRLIVAPSRSFLPDWLEQGKRMLGLACHLYAARHDGDWGIGDFTTLTRMAEKAGDHGIQALGLNPMHALFPAWPDHASPYSPSSRLFLNPLFIDVEAVAEFAAIRDGVPGVLPDLLEKARKATHVDYPLVSELKRGVFGPMFAAFRRDRGPRWETFKAFKADMGPSLDTFCLFETLSEKHKGKPWRKWTKDFRRPDSRKSKDYGIDHTERLTYHAYLQWLADEQLKAAAAQSAASGMRVGLYRDLAVGVSADGAEAWTDQDTLIDGMQFGAPGDALNPLGQAWGAPPYHPLALRERAYEPFVEVLRSNMRHAGALRIDHVMSLQHLFWIPNGADARSGAYVAYPMNELLAILALESERQKCLVIGEDLGTVPEGFQERMSEEAVLSYRVVYFERWQDGLFKRPDAYPRLALATPSTHDLPTLVGHWNADDLRIRRQLGLFSEESQIDADEQNRAHDREMLIGALADQGLLPGDFPRRAPLADDDRRGADRRGP